MPFSLASLLWSPSSAPATGLGQPQASRLRGRQPGPLCSAGGSHHQKPRPKAQGQTKPGPAMPACAWFDRVGTLSGWLDHDL